MQHSTPTGWRLAANSIQTEKCVKTAINAVKNFNTNRKDYEETATIHVLNLWKNFTS